MRKFWLLLVFSILYSTSSYGENVRFENIMKVKLILDNQKEVIVKMANNSAAAQFLTMLPADFEFTDFAKEEKISEFPKAVSLRDVPRGMIASAGKMFIYVPWGNWGFFYKNHSNYFDKNLIELGEVESGLNYLLEYQGGFNAKIEVLDNNKGN